MPLSQSYFLEADKEQFFSGTLSRAKHFPLLGSEMWLNLSVRPPPLLVSLVIEITCFLSFHFAQVHSFGRNLICFLLLVKVEMFPERYYLKDSTRAFGRLIDFDTITPDEK